jgi:DNA-binding response OmpR family regulator
MDQRILVVADDQQIVGLVKSYLELAGYTVLTARDRAAALRAIHAEHPDLVVLDLTLPGQDSWAITRAVRADPSLVSMPIIVLTARAEDTEKIVGHELSVGDYVGRPFNLRELIARVRAVLRPGGEPPLAHVLEWRGLRLDLDHHTLTRDGQPIELTPTEFDLLKTLMASPGRAFTRAELSEKGLGYTYDGPGRGIDSHIKNLRKKIEPDPLHPTYIQTVYGVGYRLGD